MLRQLGSVHTNCASIATYTSHSALMVISLARLQRDWGNQGDGIEPHIRRLSNSPYNQDARLAGVTKRYVFRSAVWGKGGKECPRTTTSIGPDSLSGKSKLLNMSIFRYYPTLLAATMSTAVY